MAGTEALEVYNTFTWETDDDKSKVNKITEKFYEYCNPRKNVTWERHKFNTRNQQQGETIDQYVTDLKTKAQTCEFAELNITRNEVTFLYVLLECFKWISTYFKANKAINPYNIDSL